MTFKLAAVLTVLAVGSVQAQVGHLPEQSPYLDLDAKHEFTLDYGTFHAGRDPLGVAPSSGPFTGFQYEYRAVNAFHLGTEISRMGSDRTIIDPVRPDSDRVVGTQKWPLYSIAGTMAVSLTGEKSWHHLVPMVTGGLGLVSDLKNSRDIGGFKFGTHFMIPWGAGIRWVPGGKLQLRADLMDRMYSISYPPTYYTAAAEGGTPILTNLTQPSRWMNNPTLTIGVTYFVKKK